MLLKIKLKKIIIDQKIIDQTAAISKLLDDHKKQIRKLEDQVLQITTLLKDL
jgi:hypothetical protein